jgi:hypothetical protein
MIAIRSLISCPTPPSKIEATALHGGCLLIEQRGEGWRYAEPSASIGRKEITT